MPTYEYKCKECNIQFERFQNMSDEPISECPECQGSVERLLSGGGGIIFKGTGFYQTDYKQKPCCSNEQGCDNPKRCCEK